MKFNEIKSNAKEIIRQNFNKIMLGTFILIFVELIIDLICPIPYELIESTEININIINLFLKYYIINFLLNMFFLPLIVGVIYYFLGIVNKKEVSYKNIFNFIPNALFLWIIYLITKLLTSIGLSFFFIPGIYLSIKFLWIYYLIADGERGILNVIKKSFSLSKGHVINYLLFVFSFIGWFALSFFTLGLSNIYVIPYIYISNILYYKELKKKN